MLGRENEHFFNRGRGRPTTVCFLSQSKYILYGKYIDKKIAAFISRVAVTFGSSFLLDEDL